MAWNRLIYGFRITSLPLLVFFTFAARGQTHLDLHLDKPAQGIIIDETTSRGIANVFVRGRALGAFSDAEGNFSIALSDGDSLHFSHVSYLPYHVLLDASINHHKLVIVLSPKITFLKEVTVTSLLSEDEFYKKILETNPQLSFEEEIAQENIQILNQASKFTMPLAMDSYQSYRDYIKGPQGVIFFSSNGSKGLVRAIKNVIRSTPYKFPSIFKRAHSPLIDTNKAK